MSASREKKARRKRSADYLSPREQKAREEAAKAKRSTTIFIAGAVVVLAFVVGLLVWNSQVVQRGAVAARVNGKTYTAADVAYFYYNGYSNLVNQGSVSSGTSLREQAYTDGEGTWFDYLSEQAIDSLASSALRAEAAEAAGFDDGGEVEKTVSSTLESLKSTAASYGYTVGQYLKAVYGPLMTQKVFERNLRMVALAEAYTEAMTDTASYSDAELTAAYESDPDAYATVHYEYAIFFAGTSDEGDGDEVARAEAGEVVARYEAGEDFQAVAEELSASYANSHAFYGTSELAQWLFDDARKDGDATVLDYYGYGYWAILFHSKERADFHPVNVRHILVGDEETANDVLAQWKAGEATEDSFAALAQEYSADNAGEGGLYTGVRIGQMAAPFEEWCFDVSRQTGDTGIVQTDYGYHVMYFVGRSERAYWQVLAADALANEWTGSFADAAEIERLDGMKYIDA